MSLQLGTVNAVVINEDTSVGVNVDTGGGGTIANAVVFIPDYNPQVGDQVLISEVGVGAWVCLGTARRDRGVDLAGLPTINVGNSTPAGVGTTWEAISSTYVSRGVTPDPDVYFVRSSTYTPPASTTLVQAASYSRSYNYTSGWRAESGRVYQGDYGFGSHSGLWFYPSMTAALTGKTVNRVRIELARPASGGSAGPVQLHFYTHSNSTLPGGAPTLVTGPVDIEGLALGWGQSATFDLPVSFGTAIQAGTAAGVAISGASFADYLYLAGVEENPASGRLTIDYT